MNCPRCTFLNLPNAKICDMCFNSINHNESLNENFMNVSPPESEDDIFGATGEYVEFYERKCKLCYGPIGTNYFAMFSCIHTFCNDCAVNYFTRQITERPVLDCTCPICNQPDLHSNKDNHGEYFSLLLSSLQPILDEHIVNVFDKKLMEIALMSDPNFMWCIRCTSGFLNQQPEKINGSVVYVQCPDCKITFCSECKKRWESQHLNLSCEQFANWKRDNNPDISNELIVNHLQKDGIDCPKCKFKYVLSRGGCIHFTCTQCKYEFCFGCRQPYVRVCKITTFCKDVGLHAHHERNCLHFLRSNTVADLQGLLKANNIKFLVESSDHLPHSKSGNTKCPIELQVMGKDTLVDTVCGEPTESGQAGLCTKHYKEYLIGTIRKAKIETSSILTVHNYAELLRYKGVTIPTRSTNQSNTEFKNTCEKLVKNNIPLQ